MSRAIALVFSAAVLANSVGANAALIDRGGGMIYDDVQNITWLADWNYARTSGHDADGRMDWATANAWATGLSYGGFDDWRLPVIAQPDPGCSISDAGPPALDYGYGCSGSEMGRMFYVNWAASAGLPFDTGVDAANLALFTNVERAPYWYRDDSLGVNAWYLQTTDGSQFTADKGDLFFAVAVRTGDVGADVTPVPAPGVLPLVVGGIVGLAVGRMRSARR